MQGQYFGRDDVCCIARSAQQTMKAYHTGHIHIGAGHIQNRQAAKTEPDGSSLRCAALGLGCLQAISQAGLQGAAIACQGFHQGLAFLIGLPAPAFAIDIQRKAGISPFGHQSGFVLLEAGLPAPGMGNTYDGPWSGVRHSQKALIGLPVLLIVNYMGRNRHNGLQTVSVSVSSALSHGFNRPLRLWRIQDVCL